jgi:hypothetical protein
MQRSSGHIESRSGSIWKNWMWHQFTTQCRGCLNLTHNMTHNMTHIMCPLQRWHPDGTLSVLRWLTLMLTQDAASQRCIVVIVMSTLDPQGRRSSAAWQPGITLQELDMADVLRLWDSLLSESLSTKAIQGHPRPSKAPCLGLWISTSSTHPNYAELILNEVFVQFVHTWVPDGAFFPRVCEHVLESGLPGQTNATQPVWTLEVDLQATEVTWPDLILFSAEASGWIPKTSKNKIPLALCLEDEKNRTFRSTSLLQDASKMLSDEYQMGRHFEECLGYLCVAMVMGIREAFTEIRQSALLQKVACYDWQIMRTLYII